MQTRKTRVAPVLILLAMTAAMASATTPSFRPQSCLGMVLNYRDAGPRLVAFNVDVTNRCGAIRGTVELLIDAVPVAKEILVDGRAVLEATVELHRAATHSVCVKMVGATVDKDLMSRVSIAPFEELTCQTMHFTKVLPEPQVEPSLEESR